MYRILSSVVILSLPAAAYAGSRGGVSNASGESRAAPTAATREVGITATGSTSPRSLEDRFADVVNVRDFGAVGDGATSDTAAIQAAIDTISARGGGEVRIPQGIWRCNVKVGSKVVLRGAGRATVLKAVAGSNAAVVEGRHFAALTGKLFEPTDIDAGDNYVQLNDLTIDGDKAAQSTGWGVRLWGRSYTWRNVVVQNCRSGGIWTEFTTHPGSTPEDLLESFFDNIKVANNGGNGWTYRGPHDSVVNGLIAAKNDGYGFQNEGRAGGYNGGVSGTNWNAWLNAKGAYKLDWTVSSLVNFIAAGEGTIGLDVSRATGMSQFVGAHLFSCSVGAVLRGVGQVLTGSISHNTTAGVRLEGASLTAIDITGTAAEGVAFDVVSEGGANSIRATVSTNGTGRLVAGTFRAEDVLSILDGFDGRGVFQSPARSQPHENLSSQGDRVVTITDGAPHAVPNPSHSAQTGERITVRVRNASGGPLGKTTWGPAYRLAPWVDPAPGYSRSVDFQYDGALWIEVSRTAVDVPN